MRILQFCPKPPKPLVDGGCIAMNAITEGLRDAGHSVKVLAISTEKHPCKKETTERYSSVRISTSVNLAGALFALLQGKNYNLSRFHNKNVERELERILQEEEFDLIILESLYTAEYTDCIKNHSKAKVLMRAHNVEHEIWEGLAEEENSMIKRWYLKKLSVSLKRRELELLSDIDSVVCITQSDLNTLRGLGIIAPMHVAPFGMEFGEYSEMDTVDHVFHFGSMDWKPNVQGVKWLMEEVWPKVRKSRPEARLILAGRNMPADITSIAQCGIEVVGEVENAEEFLKRDGIMTLPVLSGSGMRIKAVEGMATGKPLVGTALGVCGLGLTDEEHAFIADTAELFALRLIQLLSSPDEAVAMGGRGSRFIRSKFSNNLIISDLEKFIISYIAV
jgi:glycosyltransferase involved in cell wall biosynthesis